MPAVSSIVIRSAEQLVAVEPAAAPRVSVAQVSPPRGLPGAEIELRVNDTHVQWRVVGAATWTNLIALSAITGPAGATGATGAAGATGATGANGQSPELQVSGTLLQWRYAGSGGTWTTLFDLDDLAGGSDVTETVAAVAQVSDVTLGGAGAADLDGDYLDIDIGGGAIVRVWFDIDNASSPPSAPGTGRLLEVDLLSSDDTGAAATKIAAAINADLDLTASAVSNVVTVTQPAGALDAPVSTDGTNLSVNVSTAGADSYTRFLAIDGRLITNLTAENVKLGVENRILASLAGAGPGGQSATLTQVLDAMLVGSTRGSMIVRGAASWQQLSGSGLLRLISGADPALLTLTGFFIQARYFEKKDTAIVTGTTFASVFTGSITPRFSTSRIICLSMLNIGAAASNMAFVRIVRAGNVVLQGDASGSRTRVTGAHYANQAGGLQSVPILASDVPNSAAEQTYEIHLASNAAGSVYLGRSATNTDNAQFPLAPCSMVLVEVAV